MGKLAGGEFLFLNYDNVCDPIRLNVVCQKEGGNLAPLEKLEEGDEPPPLEDRPPEDLPGGSRAGA